MSRDIMMTDKFVIDAYGLNGYKSINQHFKNEAQADVMIEKEINEFAQ